MKRVCLALVLAVSSVGCTHKSRFDPTDRGYVNVEGDEKGMIALSDMLSGLITNGKASPDKTTAHWQTREKQERERTVRETQPSWVEMLAGGSNGTTK